MMAAGIFLGRKRSGKARLVVRVQLIIICVTVKTRKLSGKKHCISATGLTHTVKGVLGGSDMKLLQNFQPPIRRIRLKLMWIAKPGCLHSCIRQG
jgi:hypothetical protein